MAKNNIPTYKVIAPIEDETGVEQISFTDTPAILVKGVAFASQTPKMRIAAPVLIPMQVYRYSDDLGEFNIEFTQSEIESIAQNFQQKGKTAPFNLEHIKDSTAPAYMLESWFVGKDTKADRSWSEFGINVPQGTWMCVAQLTDINYYNKLVENNQVGLSIEGFLGLALKKQTKMNKQFKLADVKTASGDMLFIDGDIALGTSVFLITPSGDKVIPANGDVELEDGITISIKDGIIDEVSAPGEEAQDVTEGETEMADTPAPAESTTGVTTPSTDSSSVPAVPSITADDVSKMIDEKVKGIIDEIAKMQTAIEEMVAKKDAQMPKTETKMSMLDKLKVLSGK